MAIINHNDFAEGFSAISRVNSSDVATRIDWRTDFVQKKFFIDFFGAKFYEEIIVNLGSVELEWAEFRDKVKPAIIAFFCSDWLIFSETTATEVGGSSTGSPASIRESNVKKSVEQFNASINLANEFLTWLKNSTIDIVNKPTCVKQKKLLTLFNY